MPLWTGVDTQRIAADRNSPGKIADLLPMLRLLRPVLFAAAALSFPAAAQTPPTQGWPANRAPPAAPAQAVPAPPAQALPAAPAQALPAPSAAAAPAPAPAPTSAANAPIPLPFWFSEIDTAKKG